MTFNPQAPATQAGSVPAPADNAAIPAPSDASQSAPGAVADPASQDVTTRIDKIEQDLRTKYGRETADARRRAETAEQIATRQAAQISQLETRLAEIGSTISREQQAREDAVIAMLPPEQQALKKIERLEQRLANPQTGTAVAPPRPAVSPVPPPLTEQQRLAQVAARGKEIAESIGATYGVTIEYDDIPQTAWANEQTFRTVVDAIGRTKASVNGGGTPVAGKKPEGATSEVEQLRNELNQMKRQLGVSAPNSATAASTPKPGAVTDQHFTENNWAYSSKDGPRAQRERTRALRDAARAALPKD